LAGHLPTVMRAAVGLTVSTAVGRQPTESTTHASAALYRQHS
jgi:hypothetical protein